MRFKVGNKVKLREDVVVGRTYNGITLFGGCASWFPAIIARADSDGTVKVEGYGLWFGEDALELAEDTPACNFKVGEKVKLNPAFSDFRWGRGGVSYDEIGTVQKVDDERVNVKFETHPGWSGLPDELVPAFEFSAGDTVRIRKDATLKDIIEGSDHGTIISSFGFASACCESGGTYTVLDTGESGIVKLNVAGWVNPAMLELVKAAPKAEELTMAELEKRLGYPVKIIKED